MHPKRCSSCPPPPPCKKRPVRRTCWQSPVWSTILAVLAGLAVVLLLVAAMGCVSLCGGSFTAGFVAAKRRRCKGLLIGLACGIAMYLVTFLIGLLLLQSFAAAGTFSKLIFMVLCSCIGGVVGVNTKCRVPRC